MDPINPPYYKSNPTSIECIQITEQLSFCQGNAIKYVWRALEKGDPIENYEKALWYVLREISLGRHYTFSTAYRDLVYKACAGFDYIRSSLIECIALTYFDVAVNLLQKEIDRLKNKPML